MATRSDSTATRTSVSTRTLWIARISGALVILFLAFDAAIKLVPLDVVLQAYTELGWPATAAMARGLGALLLVCTLLYAWPRTTILGAILLTAYLGGSVATHLRIGSPLFSHVLFGVYLGVMLWVPVVLRDPRMRAVLPFVSGSEKG